MTRRALLAALRDIAVGTATLAAAPSALLAGARGMGTRARLAAFERPIFFDDDGLIVHEKKEGKWDGGDTAQREGWYWFGRWIREKHLNDPWPVSRSLTFGEVLRLLEPKSDGVFHRHPKLPPWNNPFDKEFGFSRDQMVPLVAAMGVWGFETELRRLWNALPQDTVGGTKHTFNGSWVAEPASGAKVFTGDIVGPMTINLFRRAWNEDPMKASDGNGPGGECELLGNVGLRLAAAAASRDDTGDDLNLIVMLLMALLRFPSNCSAQCGNLPFPLNLTSPCTRNAVELYAKNRPVSYGSFLGEYRNQHGSEGGVPDDEFRRHLDEGIGKGWPTDASRVYGAIRWYHRAKTGANPQLAELYQPIIRRFLE